jgi:molybdopterin molybdotransferase
MLISINQAIDQVLAAVTTLPEEEVDLLDALGRTLAADLVSPDDVPPFDNSAMDGFAVRAADQTGERPRLRVVAEIPAGHNMLGALPAGAAAKIMTGAPLPEGADGVVPVESTESDGATVVLLHRVEVGENVRRTGEDVPRGALLLRAGQVIGAAHLGILASAGLARVRVRRRPRVAILATGSELVPVDTQPGPGQIRNSNSYTAYGQALEAGAEPVLLGVARDDAEETRALLRTALDHDVVVTSGGVSVGEFDFVKRVQEELGVERLFWGVRTKPGKPLAFGTFEGRPVFGVPGNPVAAMVTFEMYIRPALLKMLGRPDIWRPWVEGTAEEPLRRAKERAELRRCRLRQLDGRWVFTTTGPQGSGILSSMALADGLVLVPPGFPGGAAGATLPVLLLSGSSGERPPFPE